MTHSTGSAPIIETRHLRRLFGETVAVADLVLTVEQGCIFGLLGPNGAGKSTTVKMLTTLLPPSEGSATVAGFDVVREAAQVRRHIGYVPQMVSADGNLTGRENLSLSARLYRVPRAERASRIRAALGFMDLEDAADHLVRTYSGGMIRRLELAQAMLHQPEVLFLDEPTIGLDPVARLAVSERLLDTRKHTGMTILLTTHDMEEADSLCDWVAIMYRGAIVALGQPSALKASIGEQATLDDVFIHFAGAPIEEEGGYRNVRRDRRTAQRLG